MLEQLLNLVKGEAQQDIINNPAIPNEHNDTAVGMATDAVQSGLKNALSGGNLAGLLGMFSGKSNVGGSNPIVSNIIQMFAGNLMNKLGIQNQQASGIASSLIPMVMSKLVNRTTDPNDKGFDLNGIIGSLTGGGAQAPQAGGLDFNGILSQLTGNQAVQAPQQGGNDGFGMDDIMGMLGGQGGAGNALQGLLGNLTGGAQQGNEQQGGGMMDLLKGFMK